MSALVLDGLTKRFGDVPAVEDVSLEVAPGDFCVLLGPSGCGKSTVLRLVAGLESPTAGTVSIGGRRADGLPPRDRDVAMVFQGYALYPHMRVRDNLAFPLRMRRTPREEIERRVAATARLLGIEALLDRRPRALSGGQRQRVAIGRALVREPTLFLLDEPLSNLDAALRARMRVELAALHRRLGTTTLYVTHDQGEAMTHGQTLVGMNEGRIEQVGTAADVYDQPATVFVATFVGSPPANRFDGRVASGAFEGEAVRQRVEAPDAGAATLVVRPEHVRLEAGAGRGTVELVEDLGAERFAHIRLEGGERLVVRLGDQPAPEVDATVPFRFDAERVHLFADGRRVAPA